METKLLPCPFCGGEAEFYSYGGGGYGVKCSECRCDVFSCWFSKEEAIEAWNTRHEETCEGCTNDYWCEECSRNYCDFYAPKEANDAD